MQAGDYLASTQPDNSKSPHDAFQPSPSVRGLKYTRPRISLKDQANTREDVKKLLQTAKRRFIASTGPTDNQVRAIDAMLDRNEDYHHFYLLLRLLELDIRFDCTEESISLLEQALRSPKGAQFAKRNIDIAQLRRRLSLWLFELHAAQEGGPDEDQRRLLLDLHVEMLELLLKANDTNWDTIVTAVRASALQTDEQRQVEMVERTQETLKTLGDGSEDKFGKKDRGYTLGLLYLASHTSGRAGVAGADVQLAGVLHTLGFSADPPADCAWLQILSSSISADMAIVHAASAICSRILRSSRSRRVEQSRQAPS